MAIDVRGQHGGVGSWTGEAVLLSRWRGRELRYAKRQFARVGDVALERIYDETTKKITEELHNSEEHLLAALRHGIRLRALHAVRDHAKRQFILEKMSAGFQVEGDEQTWDTRPEEVLLARQDDFLIGEFASELTEAECPVFALSAGKGLSWRAIATELAIDPNEARSLARSVEHKRERFVTLYEAGRLCGHRSRTIELLISKETTSEIALRQALAHLRHCHTCQAQHRISGQELKARFEQGALALLPPLTPHPIHQSLLDRVLLILEKPIRFFDRLTPGGGPARNRVIEAAAATGASAKAASTVAGVVAVVATGVTIGVHAVLPTHHHRHIQHRPPAASSQPATTSQISSITAQAEPAKATSNASRFGSVSREQERRVARAFGPGRVVGEPHHRDTEGQHAPGGFAYLGVPHKTQSSPEATTATTASSSTSSASEQTSSSSGGTEGQTRGGPFSP